MVMKTKVRYAILRAAFSFSGRIGRTAYGLSLIICTLLSILILTSILQTKGNTAFLVLLYIPIGWFALAQGAKRCHDLGNSGWFQWIPFYYLVLLFGKGDKEANYYGESPKYKHPKKDSLFEDTPPSDTDSASADQKTETSYNKYNKDYRKNYSKKY